MGQTQISSGHRPPPLELTRRRQLVFWLRRRRCRVISDQPADRNSCLLAGPPLDFRGSADKNRLVLGREIGALSIVFLCFPGPGVSLSPHACDTPGGIMSSTPYIGGKNIEVPPSAFSEVINPANQKPFARIFMAQEQHMRAAIDAADAAKKSWGDTLAAQREAILMRAADELEK